MPRLATLVLLTVVLVGCGMSQEERQNIAALTCSVMGESPNINRVFRIEKINVAREKLGEPPYVGGDDGIKESFAYGLCEQLVLNDPSYDATLSELQRIAAEERRQRIETARIAQQERIERERIAREEIEERERIVREEIEERERIAREEREEKVRSAQEKWRAAVEADLQDVSLEFISASYDDQNVYFDINYTCQAIDGFHRELVVVLKNNLGTLTHEDNIGSCYDRSITEGVYSFSAIEGGLEDVLYGTDDPTKFIKEIYVLIKGVHSVSPRDRMRRLDPKAYPPLDRYSKLREPIRINVTGIERAVEEQRQGEERKSEIRRQIAEGVWTCPSTAEEKDFLVVTALEQANNELYIFVANCPRL